MPDQIRDLPKTNASQNPPGDKQPEEEKITPSPESKDKPPMPPLPGDDSLPQLEKEASPSLPQEETSPPPPPTSTIILGKGQKSSKKKILLSLAVVLFLILSIPSAVYLVQQRQELRKKATGCPPDSCTGSGYLCAGNCDCNWQLSKGVRWHYKCVDGKVESYNELDSSCDSACGGTTTPTSPPSQTCPPGDQGQAGEACDNLNKCDVAGGCNPACCAGGPNDCPSGQSCDIPMGYCRSGKSCNPEGSGYHKACKDSQCVNVPGAGADECTSPDQCKGVTPPPASCQPQKQPLEGATRPGYDCDQGRTASVKLTACLPEGCPLTGGNVTYSKTVANCPGADKANCEGACGAGATTETLTIPPGQRCESTTITCHPPNNCGSCQVDIDGYGVRRWENSGCGGPTATPTTSPEYETGCQNCAMYDTDWKPIKDFSTLKVGQAIYLATTGRTEHPQGITKARFRINGGVNLTWCTGSGVGLVGTWCEAYSKHQNAFYVKYTIPAAGSYLVESMVYNPALGWY